MEKQQPVDEICNLYKITENTPSNEDVLKLCIDWVIFAVVELIIAVL